MPSRNILLLGPPSLQSVLESQDELLDQIIPPFEDLPIDELPLPTLSTFNPNDTTIHDISAIASTADHKNNTTNGKQNAVRIIEKWHGGGERLATSTPPVTQIWRVLPATRAQLHTGFTQPSYLATPSIYQHLRRNIVPLSRTPGGTSDTSMLPPPSNDILPTSVRNDNIEDLHEASLVSFADSDTHSEDSTIALLEHSFAVHNLPSSYMSIHTSPHASPRFREEEHEYASIYAKLAATNPNPQLPHIPLSSLCEIEDLPEPAVLLNRQRLSLVSMLAVVVNVSEMRTIRTKNPVGEVCLLTLTVGDESAAGFEIKVWLSTSPANIPENLAVAQTLQKGDLVLFEKIGLSVYCGVVSGSTLRHDRTRISLIYRESARRKPKLDQTDDQQIKRVRGLRDWAKRYVLIEPPPGSVNTTNDSIVVANVRSGRPKGSKNRKGLVMPADTQISVSGSVKTRARTKQEELVKREVEWKKRRKG